MRLVLLSHRSLAVLCGAVLVASATPALLPGGAAAKPRYEEIPGILAAKVELPASRGFDLSIEGFGHRHVELAVRRGPFYGAYRVRGRVSRKRIEADLGSFGRISLRFRGKRVERPDFGCKGRPPIAEVGRFRGTVEFHGESGFVEAAVRHAPGVVEKSFRQACPAFDRPAPASAPSQSRRLAREEDLGFTFTILTAASSRAQPELSFNATRLDLRGLDEAIPWSVDASLFEKVGRVGVSKVISVDAGAKQIVVSPPGARPATAVAMPPAPFSGSASYDGSLGAGANWTGDLAVSFPGLGAMPLAGSGFLADLCRSEDLEMILNCLGA